MDILYQLPFPQEVCSKIFNFACKNPYTDLGVSIFKKKLYGINLNIPDNDQDVIIINTNDESNCNPYEEDMFD